MHIPWFVILGPIALVWVASYIVCRIITEHIDARFEELKEWMKKNST